MDKRVIVIAEGETDRLAIEQLLEHLKTDGITVKALKVGRRLDVETVKPLVLSAWYAPPDNVAPDKFVILVDADGRDPDEVLRPLREELSRRVGPKVTAALQFAYAQWHLEAWFFADVSGLRAYLGRDPGNVDTSQPDQIQKPKLHLKNLLGDRGYTPVVSEEIAGKLSAQTIDQRSPSFHGFLEAVRNGELARHDEAG